LYEDVDLALGMSIVKQFWASKYDGLLGVKHNVAFYLLSMEKITSLF